MMQHSLFQVFPRPTALATASDASDCGRRNIASGAETPVEKICYYEYKSSISHHFITFMIRVKHVQAKDDVLLHHNVCVFVLSNNDLEVGRQHRMF